jgi:hypothetical protein
MFEGEYDPESAWVFRMLDETEWMRENKKKPTGARRQVLSN